MTGNVHGGRVFEAAASLGRPWRDIIDFSANINPLGQVPGLKKAVTADFDRSLHYPEPGAESFRRQVAGLHGLSPDHILPGAGSTPHFFLLARSLGFTRPVIVGPAFAEYEAAVAAAGLTARYVLTREEDDWLVTSRTLDLLRAADPDAVFLAQPANPTGRLVPPEILRELADECRGRDVWLLADEAFIDFTGRPEASLMPLVGRHPKLAVLRSLTKIYALPGLRAAYLAAPPRVTAHLAARLGPWPLSSPALSAVAHGLARPDFPARTASAVARYRRRLTRELESLALGRVFPSEANFLLWKLRAGLSPAEVLDHLFRDGILVRDAANFRGLAPGYLRLAVRPPREIEALGASLRLFKAGGNHA